MWFSPTANPGTGTDFHTLGRSQELLTLPLTLDIFASKTPRKHTSVPSVVTMEAMTYEGALLLAADRTPLAERYLLVPAVSLVFFPKFL